MGELVEPGGWIAGGCGEDIMNNDLTNRLVDLEWLIIDTVVGPWFSLGFHIDFKRPYIDIHFWWLIITIGNYYGFRIPEEEPPTGADAVRM